MDDRDLDSAALWAAVDSAATAQASRRDHVPRRRNLEDDEHRGGEVVQPVRPFKVPRLLATPPPLSPLPLQTPLHSSPNLTLTPDAASASATRLVVVDTTPPTAHLFPAISVANFRKYQEAALSIKATTPPSVGIHTSRNQAGGKYHASSISHLKSRTAPLNLMKTAMSTVPSFSFERLCKVAGFRMVGVHVIGGRKNLTNQTMMFPAQLKPELRTKLVSITQHIFSESF